MRLALVATLATTSLVACSDAPLPFTAEAEALRRAMHARYVDMDGGFASYMRDGAQLDPSEAGVGRERTSESTGLLMAYATQIGDRPLYVRARTFYERVLRDPRRHLATWKVDAQGAPVRNGDGSISSAPIDELRIARALDAGVRLFADRRSTTLLREQARALRAAVADGIVADDVSWDPHAPEPNDGVLTAYLDVRAMRVLARYEPAWREALGRSAEVAARLGAMRPPRTAWDAARDAASCDNGSCGTIPALWIALHLLDDGERDDADAIRRYYAGLMERLGVLPGTVDADGTPGRHEDLASYALLARLHARLGARAEAHAMVRTHLLPRRRTAGPLAGLFTFEDDDAPGFDNLVIASTLAELQGRRAPAD